MTNAKDQNFVIVGASLAGALAARTLREEGFDGRVVLIGAEPHPPYERPPLSKDYLRGETPRAKTYVHPKVFYADNEIELLTSTTVREIDAPASEVVATGVGAFVVALTPMPSPPSCRSAHGLTGRGWG